MKFYYFFYCFLLVYFSSPGYAVSLFDASFFENGESYTELAVLDGKNRGPLLPMSENSLTGRNAVG